jgi:iron(III) transport system ATP-binding protein
VNDAAVLLRAVSVEAGKTRILGPIDLAVAPGEHLLVAGRSGSGKTTLLRAIAGLARPSTGKIELFGVAASEGPRLLLAPERRRIGFLFQGGALWPHMSCARTLDFALRASGTPRGEVVRRRGELLDWVELTGYEKRMPGTLSGGEAQRLALARALAAQPRLLLLDEPLGPLDAELRGSLLARLAALQRELDLTVVHVTHDPDEAAALASRTLRLEAGRIAAEPREPEPREALR